MSALPRLRLLAILLLLAFPACKMSPGYRDQAYHAIDKGTERGDGQARPLGRDIVKVDEFLSAYQFALPAKADQPVTARLIYGGSGTNRERQNGYLMLAISAPAIPEAQLPPRHWIIALDTSHSMADANRWQLATKAATRLISRMRPQDKVTLLIFGGETRVLADNAPSLVGAEQLRSLAAKPKFGENRFENGLDLLSKQLWQANARGEHASAFLITEMEGAPQNLPSQFTSLRKVGGEINIIGLPGGDEVLLRATARATGGSYIFLDSESIIERDLGARANMLFDTAASDIKVTFVNEARLLLRELDAAAHTSNAAPAPAAIQLVAEIPRLGPGEVWVKLWAIDNFNPKKALPITAKIAGRSLTDKQFSLLATAGGYQMTSAPAQESRALCKAITIADEALLIKDTICHGYRGHDSYADTMAKIKDMKLRLREAQATLNDPEFARDLAAFESLSNLTEADIEKYRKMEQQHPGSWKRFGIGVAIGSIAVTLGPFLLLGWLIGGIC